MTFDYLQIYERRERLIVGLADVVLGVVTIPARALRRRRASASPRRILLLRLERIGDLLMAMPALEAVRERAPGASLHLVVGSWNAAIAGMLGAVDSYETLDAPWLARSTAGSSLRTLLQHAWRWRARQFDLAINFEPDIRSNLLVGLSGAPRRFGFQSGGGARLLTDALDYDPSQHTADNLVRLVDAALPASVDSSPHLRPRLRVPDAAREEARALVRGPNTLPVLVGLHVSGGRNIKQWSLDRFAEVAMRVAREHDAALVFTGTSEDRPLVDHVVAGLPQDIVWTNVAGAVSLDVLAALLEQLDVLVTGDTGPMHLAAAVGTPIVAIFGPSDPARYSPLTDSGRVVTADLWCRPCNRIRRPPARCAAGVPDCLRGVGVAAVVDAVAELLSAAAPRAITP